jgi:hypothetical protein
MSLMGGVLMIIKSNSVDAEQLFEEFCKLILTMTVAFALEVLAAKYGLKLKALKKLLGL